MKPSFINSSIQFVQQTRTALRIPTDYIKLLGSIAQIMTTKLCSYRFMTLDTINFVETVKMSAHLTSFREIAGSRKEGANYNFIFGFLR